MQFYKSKSTCGMVEYRAVVKLEDGRDFAYHASLDQDKRWSNDFALHVNGKRYIIGYMDHEDEGQFVAITPMQTPREALVAIMFSMTEEFDSSEDSGLDFYIN